MHVGGGGGDMETGRAKVIEQVDDKRMAGLISLSMKWWVVVLMVSV